MRVPEIPDIRKLRFPGIWIYIPVFLGLAGLAYWAVSAENDFSFYWRDPAAIVNTGPWIGLFSNIGVFIWWIAGVICVFTSIVIWNVPQQRRNAMFLMSWGILTGFLALDDFFMIHEWVIPTYLPLSDDFMFGVYFIVTLALLVIFREEIRRSPFQALFLALVCFGASIVIDMVGPFRLRDWGVPVRLIWNLEYVVENGLKFVGLIAWLHYFGLTCTEILRRILLPTEMVSSERELPQNSSSSSDEEIKAPAQHALNRSGRIDPKARRTVVRVTGRCN